MIAGLRTIVDRAVILGWACGRAGQQWVARFGEARRAVWGGGGLMHGMHHADSSQPQTDYKDNREDHQGVANQGMPTVMITHSSEFYPPANTRLPLAGSDYFWTNGFSAEMSDPSVTVA